MQPFRPCGVVLLLLAPSAGYSPYMLLPSAMMLRFQAIAAAAVAALPIVVHAQASVSMPTTWKYLEEVVITGTDLEGDQPLYKELCFAPAALPNDKTCYDEHDMKFSSWSHSKISFLPPDDIPLNGVVTLHRGMDVQKCFGSAGCLTTTEEEDVVLGEYKTQPYIHGVVQGSDKGELQSFETGGVYGIVGRYFGEMGDVYMLTQRSSAKLDSKDIIEWTPSSIVFKIDATKAIGIIGVSVNNKILSSEKWLTTDVGNARSSSSSSVARSSAPSSTKASATVGASAFSDVPPSHAYVSAVTWAKSQGVLQGYPDGTFKPDNVVNRAEFLKIVLEAKGVDVSGVNSAGFSDVDESAWYAPYVRYAKANGIIQGYADGTFKPNQEVNFAEALKMAYNTLGVSTNDIGGEWYARFSEHAKLNGVLFDTNARVDGGMSRKDVVWIVWKIMNHGGAWSQPEKMAARITFGDGTYIVGEDVQPGTYRTRTGKAGCYYERLSGFGGELSDIVSNEFTNDSSIVVIASSDVGFKSKGCGTWTNDLSAITSSRTSFGDGTFIIGTDIEPGTYKNVGGTSCYYARLSGFEGSISDIITNENVDSSAIVTISAGDKGFKSSRCGTWTKMK